MNKPIRDDERIAREMERILRDQAAPNRPSPLAERWAYLEKVDAERPSNPGER